MMISDAQLERVNLLYLEASRPLTSWHIKEPHTELLVHVRAWPVKCQAGVSVGSEVGLLSSWVSKGGGKAELSKLYLVL